MAYDALLTMKLIGASIGSSIAIVFSPGRDSKLKLLKRFIIGVIIGFIFAPILIDWLGWPHQLDYWLAASVLSGLCGYLSLQVLFTIRFSDIINKKMTGK